MADQTTPTIPAAASFDGADHLSHFSHGDYDWMGVLDGCFGHPMDGHEPHHPHPGGTAATATNPGDSAAVAMAAAQEHAHSSTAAATHREDKPCDLSEITEHTAAAPAPLKSCDTAPSIADAKTSEAEQPCIKQIDRVERKRNREKQRRLDTNSQFTTLAAIVREIETTDFVEEAHLNNLYELTHPQNDGEDADSNNKRLKSDTTAFASGSIQHAISAAGTYSASNRVELIARTSLMLSQFRAIRKKRNEELRDARRLNCEMKKEVEELRRTVAHYKTVGMGMQKPQDKIMMMVPMMVPQDAVNSVSAGFPAAHLMGGGGCFAPQWMPTSAMAQTMPMNNMHTQFHHQPSQDSQTSTAPFAQFHGNQNYQMNSPFQFNQQQATNPSPGVASLQNNMTQAQAAQDLQVPNMTQQAPSNTNDSNPPSTGHNTPQPNVQLLQVPTQLTVPSLNQGMMQQPLQNPMGMMFPQTNMGAPIALPNMQNPSDASVQQPSNGLAQQPPSEKPSSSACQGGGGNLAHCA